MTRDRFEDMLPDAELVGEGGGYAHYQLTSAISLGERSFLLSANFEGDVLRSVVLHDARMPAAGWDGVTPEAIDRAKAANATWLQTLLGGADRQFAWGRIVSGTDERSGLPEIVLSYDKLSSER